MNNARPLMRPGFFSAEHDRTASLDSEIPTVTCLDDRGTRCHRRRRDMRLSLFIRENMEAILTEWEAFARSRDASAAALSPARLRDHAQLMLEAIATDISEDQTAAAQDRKARGEAPVQNATLSAASSHGTDREDTGFTLVQLIAEFRAVRASVLRRWLPSVITMDDASFIDMLRFNEAVDQAIAESVATFSQALGETRDTFLGMLGHDLRGPLQVMTMAGSYLARGDVDPEKHRTAARRIVRSAALMSGMVNDLLDYARLQLGGLLNVECRNADLGAICTAALEDARAVHSTCDFRLDLSGSLLGEIDEPRLLQALSNLLNNAAQYRNKNSAVTLRAFSRVASLGIDVQNFGPVIPPAFCEAIFEPLVQLDVDEGTVQRPQTSIGLGLFIARKIVEAHGGTIIVSSNETTGTTFSIDIPRARCHSRLTTIGPGRAAQER